MTHTLKLLQGSTSIYKVVVEVIREKCNDLHRILKPYSI